jgi:predicted ester cyclase
MTSSELTSASEIRAFIDQYYKAWHGTDEDHILAYYADNVSVELPGMLINGRTALRDQFVRPFIAAFPGNRHIVKNMVFAKDMVVVEFSFEAEHNGPFAGRAATGIPVRVPGCGVYEFDPVHRKITAARIYFEFATLLKQISAHQPKVLQELLMSWFASQTISKSKSASNQLSH